MIANLPEPRPKPFTYLLLACAGMQALTLSIVVTQGFALRRLYNKEAPTLVQTTDGQAFRVHPIPSTSRTDATIQLFTVNTLTQLFNWSGHITADNNEPVRDPGVDIETPSGSQKVTTASFTASFAIAEDFRLPFLKKVAELTPTGVFSRQTQVVLVVDQVSTPEQLNPGLWQLTVLAHLNVLTSDNSLQETIPFHREILVEVITAPAVPLGETPLEQAIYQIRQAGLQITDIRPLSAG